MLGDYLKTLRGNKSIRQAAKDIGISHTYLDSLEKGYDPRTNKKRIPSVDTMMKISEYYNIPLSDLIEVYNLNNKVVNAC